MAHIEEEAEDAQAEKQDAGPADHIGEDSRRILTKIPVTVEIATANPIASGPTPNDATKSGRTGVRAKL